MADPVLVRLQITTAKPPAVHDGRQTEFGLQDKKRQLHAGKSRGRHLVFGVELPFVITGESVRFRGPFAHGSGSPQHLYIGWRFPGDNLFINRLKIFVPVSRETVETAAEKGLILCTDATGPAWGVLKNWHGLGMGENWHAEKPG